MALVADTAAGAAAARLELARIGYDDILGWVDARTLRGTEPLKQLNVCDLRKELRGERPPMVLDVRSSAEWQAGHIPDARHAPLPSLPGALDDLPRDIGLAAFCGGGYRSSLAASLLRRHGFTRLRNVAGGMTAFVETKCPEK